MDESIYKEEFIITLKTFWKYYHNNKIESLYSKLLPSKAGNKSMFDNELRSKKSSYEKYAYNIEKVTGVNHRYILGIDGIEGIKDITEWEEYILLRRKNSKKYTVAEKEKSKELKKTIENQLKEILINKPPTDSYSPLGRLIYFCHYGSKIESRDVMFLIQQVQDSMRNIRPEALNNISEDKYAELEKNTEQFLQRIRANKIMRDWKNEV